MKSSKPKRSFSFFTRIIIILNLVAVSGLFMAYLSGHIPPAKFPIIAFAGLAYPYVLILNVVFVLFWLLSKKRFAFISIVAILLGWNQIGRLVRINTSSPDLSENVKIKVLSYNIQNFIGINTSTTKYLADFSNEESIIKFIKSQNADIICLQEMLYDREDIKSFPVNLGSTFNCPDFYYENYYNTSTKKLDAIATFTKYKIISNGHLKFEDKSIGIFNDLILYGDTVRVYNLHLASIHLQKDDYEFMSDIASNKENENFKTKSRDILSKLQSAFIKRGRQANMVANHISKCKYPVIICGDLNDTPFSYVYEKISGNLKDAFVQSGSGFGETYAGDDFPSLRIDYIFHDKKFNSNSFTRSKVFLSDHFPVSTVLTIIPK